MTSRKIISLFLLVIIVGLAGCSVPFITDDTETTPTPTPNNATSIDYPYGWNESGLRRIGTKQDNPILQDNSLTIKFERKIELDTNNNGEYTTESHLKQTHKVNAVQNKWNITSKQLESNVIQEYYFSQDREYSHTVLLNESGSVETESYEQSNRQFSKQTAFQLSGSEVLILSATYPTPTVTTYQGKDALHYQTNNMSRIASNSPIFFIGDSSNVTSVESEVYVEQETGKVLYTETRIIGQRGNDDFRATISFEYSNFSNTTVNEPSWVETAKNQTRT